MGAMRPTTPNRRFAGMMDGTVWMSRDGARSSEKVLGALPTVMGGTVAQA